MELKTLCHIDEWFANLPNAQTRQPKRQQYTAPLDATLAPVRQWRPGRVLRRVQAMGENGGLFPEVLGRLMRQTVANYLMMYRYYLADRTANPVHVAPDQLSNTNA